MSDAEFEDTRETRMERHVCIGCGSPDLHRAGRCESCYCFGEERPEHCLTCGTLNSTTCTDAWHGPGAFPQYVCLRCYREGWVAENPDCERCGDRSKRRAKVDTTS